MFMKISSAQGRDNILMLRKAHRRSEHPCLSEMSPNITIQTVMNVCLIRIAVWRGFIATLKQLLFSHARLLALGVTLNFYKTKCFWVAVAQLCGTVKSSLLLLLLLFVVVVVVFVSGVDLCLWASGSRDLKKIKIWYASCCKRSAAEHFEKTLTNAFHWVRGLRV